MRAFTCYPQAHQSYAHGQDYQFNSYDQFRREEEAGLVKTLWEQWAEKVERLLGHSLDGDQKTDGYSIDFAYKEWQAHRTPEQYVAGLQ